MKESKAPDETRRRLLRTIAVAPVMMAFPSLFAVAGCSSGSASDARAELPATPSCPDDDEPTEAQTEGPFFKVSSPRRTSLLEPGIAGTKLVVSGLVLTRSCKPVPNALVDFWQADDAGEYDNVTFKLRGHQFTDAKGAWRLETIVPGLYPGRTRHIHVKAQAPNKPVLTTQLYLAGEKGNTSDRIFDSDLVMTLNEREGVKEGRFDFVLDLP